MSAVGTPVSLPEQAPPIFRHNCDSCIFLGGHASLRDGELWFFDLYFHPGTSAVNEETVIARFGGDGSYYSGMTFAAPYVDITGAQQPGIPELVEAKRRAAARGLLKERA